MNTEIELIQAFLHNGKYDAITKTASILHPDKKEISVTESYVDGVRLVTDENTINILCPFDMGNDRIMEAALADAISSGEIYDDAEKIKDHADLIRMTTLPNVALTHKDLPAPTGITKALTPVIAKMNDDTGRFEVTDSGITNGVNCVKNLVATEKPADEVRRVMDNYIADHDLENENDKSPVDIASIVKDVNNIHEVDATDTISEEDYDEIDYDDNSEEDEELRQEGFITRRPKKLKPISRDIVPYVNEQMRNIKTSNDQAMIAGYVSNKLEFIDFYITVIDTNDERFIVPHSRDYLISLQNDLNRLLTQILNIRPVNKYDRIWKMNLPEGYQG